MTVRMLLRKVKLGNLLSFRSTEVELRGLNVLIGANASGKSNLIEAIGLLQAAPIDLSAAIRRLGGVRVVCSLAGSQYSPIALIECAKSTMSLSSTVSSFLRRRAVSSSCVNTSVRWPKAAR
jgi:predicted ATPase